ncbi:S26 family signal peptidase [Micromonospora chaiyaphumensis]|uniref:Signal peptidase I n=1 Tax=Micromonospora chaiyaphumensis TaxID=307119 RepID=A0A1C4WCX6_9ACTN|nr:S26 family signal peptidase [Micromonospora chaiyaphumensis]SCE94040.1 signal peptidase I [Micromonospora chaiyaphumensis]
MPGTVVAAALAGSLLAGTMLFLRLRYVRVTVLGRSMEPTLTQGDRVLMVRRTVRPGDRGALVLLVAPPDATREPGLGEWRIKRLVALAGDPVPPEVRAARNLPAGATVRPGEVMVIGDNPRSEDSRQWARLPARLVVAVARCSG